MAGRWRLTATLRRRGFALGSIRVTAATYALDQPAQVLVRDDGTLLVSERGSRNRVLSVDPATGRFRVFAGGILHPWGLAKAPDGSILISSETGIFRVAASGGRPVKIAEVESSPILAGTGGAIYYGYLAVVGRIPAGSRAGQPLPLDVEAPHGLAFAAGGDLVVSDTGHDRVLRLDLASGHVSTLAAGLRTPMGIVAEPGGTFLVLEFAAEALTRIDESGARSTVATGLKTPYALARATDGTVYVVETGKLFPPSGRLRRVAPDGSVSTIELRR